MDYAALSCVEDAIDTTKEFLLPVDRSRWLRLAVVVFFLSGSTGASSSPNVSAQFPFGEVRTEELPGWQTPPEELLEQFLPILVGLVAVFAVVGAVFALVGSIMEFVLVDSLRKQSVTVRASMREFLGQGLALFAFRLLLGIVFLAIVGGTAALLVLPAIEAGGAQLVLAIVVVGFLAVTLGFLGVVADGLTTHFVVPTMIHEGRGLRSAWGRFYPVLRSNLAEFGVYVLVRIGLAIGVGFVGTAATGIVGTVLAIPFVLLGGGVWLAVGGSLTLSTAVAFGALVAIYVLLLLALTAVVQVPLKTFTRYYELLVLGDVEPALDLIPDQRAAVRGSASQD